MTDRRVPAAFEPADLYRVLLWIAMKPFFVLAPMSFLLRIAVLRGTLDSLISPIRTEILQTLDRHLGRTHSARQRRVIARRYHQYRHKQHLARVWPQIRDFAGSDAIEIDGLEHLDRALEAGNGVILASAHYGYARLIKPILRSRGRDVLLVGPLPPGRRVEDYPPFFTRFGEFVHTNLLGLPRASTADERWNQTVGVDLPAGLNLRAHMAALSRNQTLVILADGRSARALRPARVLDVDVPLASGAVSLGRGTGAAVLPTFVVDDPHGAVPTSLRLIIHPKLELQSSSDPRADVEENVGRFAAVYDAHARSFPHNWHWSWVHDGLFSGPR